MAAPLSMPARMPTHPVQRLSANTRVTPRRCEHRSRWRARCGERRPVVAIPVALELLPRVVNSFESQELAEPRIARLDLRAGRVAVIGQVEAPVAADRHVDQPAERLGGMRFAGAVVPDVQVEDYAR